MEEWICEAPEGDLYGVSRKPLLRCKDCKYCEIFGNGYNSYCTDGHNIAYVDGFCSEAQLRE